MSFVSTEAGPLPPHVWTGPVASGRAPAGVHSVAHPRSVMGTRGGAVTVDR